MLSTRPDLVPERYRVELARLQDSAPSVPGSVVQELIEKELGLPPAEAFALLDAGADALKLFPAEGGSPAMLRALLAVLPAGTMVLPVGGMEAGTLAAWRAAGATGFGIGGAIYKPGDDAAAVAAKAARLMTAVREG